MGRFYSGTAQPTTLAAACTNSATSIQVTATTGFPAVEFILALDYGGASQELVKVTNVAGTTLTVVRGFDSTTAQAHSLGAAVQHVHSADDFRLSRTHEAASTGVHGAAGAVVGTTDAQALSNKDLTAGTNTFPASLATAANLTAHTGATAAHGATGAVVGTTNSQTLTNKTLTTPVLDTPSYLGDFIGAVRYIEKSSDQGPVASSTVFVDDTALQFSVVANAVYVATWVSGFAGTANTGGLKWQFTGPAGATGTLGSYGIANGGFIADSALVALPIGSNFPPTIGDGFNTVSTRCILFNSLRIKTSATAGTVKLQFAQQTSNVTGVTSKAGSYLVVHRVA